MEAAVPAQARGFSGKPTGTPLRGPPSLQCAAGAHGLASQNVSPGCANRPPTPRTSLAASSVSASSLSSTLPDALPGSFRNPILGSKLSGLSSGAICGTLPELGGARSRRPPPGWPSEAGASAPHGGTRRQWNGTANCTSSSSASASPELPPNELSVEAEPSTAEVLHFLSLLLVFCNHCKSLS